MLLAIQNWIIEIRTSIEGLEYKVKKNCHKVKSVRTRNKRIKIKIK